MASVGWAKLGVSVDASGLRKGVQGIVADLDRLKTRVMQFAAGFVALETLKGAFDKVKESIEGISQTKILAERVGMSAEAFGKLSYAAKRAHMEQEDLATSLEQMSKRLGEVAMEGSGPAADALKRLGLSAAKLAKMGNEAAFFKIIGVLEKIQNPAQRSAVAMDLFGRSGMAMINLMAQGSEEIRKAGDEALRVGYALNAVDTAKVEAADQAFIRLGAAGQGFANMLAVQLAPYIELVTQKYYEFAYGGAKSTTFLARAVDIVNTVLGVFMDGVNLVKAGWYGMQAAVSTVLQFTAKGIQAIVDGLDWMIDKIADGAQWLAKMAGASEDMQARIGAGVRGVGHAANPMEALGKNFFGEWSKDLGNMAADQADKAMSAFNNVGLGKGIVEDFLKSINDAANNRAAITAGQSAAFVNPGGIREKPEPTKFAGAAELASKDAYSAILRSRSQQQNQNEARRTAKATERTADGVARTNQFLEKLAGRGGVGAPGKGAMITDQPASF